MDPYVLFRPEAGRGQEADRVEWREVYVPRTKTRVCLPLRWHGMLYDDVRPTPPRGLAAFGGAVCTRQTFESPQGRRSEHPRTVNGVTWLARLW